ncbi:MAG: arginine--tRNA ligase [Bacilli bacterium]|nr:arginine--tRNA ligase [Bacilli bacterium]
MINQTLENLKLDLKEIIKELGVEEDIDIFFEVPKDPTFGDYSVNVAMRLARALRKSPLIIANDIVSKIDLKKNNLSKVEVAGAGFINFFMDQGHLNDVVFQIISELDKFGSSNIGNGKKINLEYVSANPTGFLHVGHARGAAYGDSMARILTKCGYDVTREYYVNDGGNQINNLAYSIYERYKEQLGLECNLLDDYYHGPEIITIAKDLVKLHGDKYLKEDWFAYFREYGVKYLLDQLKVVLTEFGVDFDVWFSEKSLYDSGAVKATIDKLVNDGDTYTKDGAIWLKTEAQGDEKDRVIVKSDSTLTYLTPDIAYHSNKLSRGYDTIIDVLGADHHGYIDRLKAAIYYMGYDPDKLIVEILQMVRVLKDGEEVKMSKRSGKAITLKDLIDEAGVDALRYMFSSKALSSHMDLDLDLIVKQSNENPVYYVQYAYARICSLFRNMQANNLEFIESTSLDKVEDEVKELVGLLLQYPKVVEEAATKRLPHKISTYVYSLASAFHSFYNDNKIISDDLDKTNQLLTVSKATGIVLKDALSLIGVGVKEKM